jgi:hypothetical protein
MGDAATTSRPCTLLVLNEGEQPVVADIKKDLELGRALAFFSLSHRFFEVSVPRGVSLSEF